MTDICEVCGQPRYKLWHGYCEPNACWCDDPEISPALWQERCDSLVQEIERLRALLQWWLDAGPDADWDEHEKRVREALGHE